MITAEDINEVTSDYNRAQKIWRAHRRACLELIDLICESHDIDKCDFQGRLGIEDDWCYGV